LWGLWCFVGGWCGVGKRRDVGGVGWVFVWGSGEDVGRGEPGPRLGKGGSLENVAGVGGEHGVSSFSRPLTFPEENDLRGDLIVKKTEIGGTMGRGGERGKSSGGRERNLRGGNGPLCRSGGIVPCGLSWSSIPQEERGKRKFLSSLCQRRGV